MLPPPAPAGACLDSTADFAPLQLEVQRELGRCLLRLQQYERLLKSLLAWHSVAGHVDQLAARVADQEQTIANQTLGTLVGRLCEQFLQPKRDDPEPPQHIDIPERPGLVVRFTSVALPREELESSIKKLVTLRNTLVHHFIEHFDLWTVSGCRDAQAELARHYTNIDAHLKQLAGWVASSERVRALGEHLDSSPFLDEVLGQMLAKLPQRSARRRRRNQR